MSTTATIPALEAAHRIFDLIQPEHREHIVAQDVASIIDEEVSTKTADELRQLSLALSALLEHPHVKNHVANCNRMPDAVDEQDARFCQIVEVVRSLVSR